MNPDLNRRSKQATPTLSVTALTVQAARERGWGRCAFVKSSVDRRRDGRSDCGEKGQMRLLTNDGFPPTPTSAVAIFNVRFPPTATSTKAIRNDRLTPTPAVRRA